MVDVGRSITEKVAQRHEKKIERRWQLISETNTYIKKCMMNVVVIGLEAGNHLETREASLWEKVREKKRG